MTPPAPAAPKKKIHRHKTALVRREISKLVKTLLELGQLRRGESFFDYGIEQDRAELENGIVSAAEAPLSYLP
jgi:hypothetical protein